MEDELFVQAGNQGRTMEDAVLREVSGAGALNRHPLSKEGSTLNPSVTRRACTTLAFARLLPMMHALRFRPFCHAILLRS